MPVQAPPVATQAPLSSAPLPAALVRDLVRGLGDLARDGKPLSPALAAALAELDRMVRKRAESDPERIFLDGLKGAARGRAGEGEWANAAKSLHQSLRQVGGGTPDALRFWERLADLQAAQGLPDYPWRDRALALRWERSRGVDEGLEAGILASLKDHWGGFLEPPRRAQTLARCGELTDLWLRRSAKDRARAMGRSAFASDAGALWKFAYREGDNDLRTRLRDCLRDLPAQDLAANLDERPFLQWVSALAESDLAPEVQGLIQDLDPFVEVRWGFYARVRLLKEAGLLEAYVDLLRDGLERLSREDRRELIRKSLLDCPKLDATLARRAQERLLEDPVLREDEKLRAAWAARGAALEGGAEGGVDGAEPDDKAERPAKGKGDAPETATPRERNLLDPDAEVALLRAFEAGELDQVETQLWPLLEALARGELPGPFRANELEVLPGILVEPWLRRRAPEEALLRLERLERILLRSGSPLSDEFHRQLPLLRRKTDRQRRLIGLLGAAADP